MPVKIPGSLSELAITKNPDESYLIELVKGSQILAEQLAQNKYKIRVAVKKILDENGIQIPDVRLIPLSEDLLKLVNDQDRIRPTEDFISTTVKAVFQAGNVEITRGSETSEVLPSNGKKKILIFGLDRAGKTSINQRVFGALRPYSIDPQPTLGIELEKFQTQNVDLTLWDLGGQSQYRKHYMEPQMAEKIFSEPDVLIFVFDSSDASRYEESLEYFRWIWKNLDASNYKGKFHFFIHKTDVIREKTPIQDYLKKELGEVSTNLKFHYTSIFEESLYVAWSKIMIDLFPRGTLLSKILENLKNQQGFGDSVVLLRKSGLICASSGQEDMDEILMEFSCLLLTTVEKISNNLLHDDVTRVTIQAKDTSMVLAEIDEATVLAIILEHAQGAGDYLQYEGLFREILPKALEQLQGILAR